MITMEWQTKIQRWYLKLLLTLGQCDLCGNDLSDNLANIDLQKQNVTRNSPQQTLICSCCLDDLPLFNQIAVQGDLLNWPAINKALPLCAFDHLVCLSPYLPPFTQWLPQYKYNGRFELATFFADLLARQWQETILTTPTLPVDLILSVPLHINKWQERGYNQAHLIAKPFAQHLQLPYDAHTLMRTKKNKSQVGQTGSQRRKNLTNAFTLTKALPSNIKHVILLDDVLTTGSTASEISKVLKYAGVDKITVVAVCLSLPSH